MSDRLRQQIGKTGFLSVPLREGFISPNKPQGLLWGTMIQSDNKIIKQVFYQYPCMRDLFCPMKYVVDSRQQ